MESSTTSPTHATPTQIAFLNGYAAGLLAANGLDGCSFNFTLPKSRVFKKCNFCTIKHPDGSKNTIKIGPLSVDTATECIKQKVAELTANKYTSHKKALESFTAKAKAVALEKEKHSDQDSLAESSPQTQPLPNTWHFMINDDPHKLDSTAASAKLEIEKKVNVFRVSILDKKKRQWVIKGWIKLDSNTTKLAKETEVTRLISCLKLTVPKTSIIVTTPKVLASCPGALWLTHIHGEQVGTISMLKAQDSPRLHSFILLTHTLWVLFANTDVPGYGSNMQISLTDMGLIDFGECMPIAADRSSATDGVELRFSESFLDFKDPKSWLFYDAAEHEKHQQPASQAHSKFQQMLKSYLGLKICQENSSISLIVEKLRALAHSKYQETLLSHLGLTITPEDEALITALTLDIAQQLQPILSAEKQPSIHKTRLSKRINRAAEWFSDAQDPDKRKSPRSITCFFSDTSAPQLNPDSTLGR